jgi:antitoxin CcdA
MKHEVVRGRRRATNVTLPEELVAQARALNVNLSKSCEAGLVTAVDEAAKRRWKSDNADWITAHRRWVEEKELPLERYRLF